MSPNYRIIWLLVCFVYLAIYLFRRNSGNWGANKGLYKIITTLIFALNTIGYVFHMIWVIDEQNGTYHVPVSFVAGFAIFLTTVINGWVPVLMEEYDTGSVDFGEGVNHYSGEDATQRVSKYFLFGLLISQSINIMGFCGDFFLRCIGPILLGSLGIVTIGIGLKKNIIFYRLRFIFIPLGLAAWSSSSVYCHLFTNSGAGLNPSSWLDRIFIWNIVLALAPVRVLYNLYPGLPLHPFAVTIIVFCLIGVILVITYDQVKQWPAVEAADDEEKPHTEVGLEVGIIEVSNNSGFGDGSPLVVEAKPDLRAIFSSEDLPAPQLVTDENRKYWQDAENREKEMGLATGYLQHPDHLVRLEMVEIARSIGLIKSPAVVQALIDRLADEENDVRQAAARALWDQCGDDSCAFVVRSLRDEIRGYVSLGPGMASKKGLTLGREKAINALTLLVEEAPSESARAALEQLIDREIVIEERIRLVKNDSIEFLGKEYKNDNRTGARFTYEVYRAESKEQALSFLKTRSVNEKNYYIEVETPDGTYGRDIEGMYNL